MAAALPRLVDPLLEGDDLGRAAGWLRAGRAGDAERLARAVVEAAPRSAPAWSVLGQALRQQGHTAEAAAAWERAAGILPDAETDLKLGRAWNELGRFAQAADVLSRAVAARPGWFAAQLQLGIAFGSCGRADDAIRSFRAAVDADPAAAHAHHNLGVALVQAGRPADGIAALREALRLQPGYPEAHYNLANALATVGRKADAVAHYRQAVAQRPVYAEALNNLGFHLAEGGHPEEAIPYLRQAARLRPAATDAVNNLGIALEALGRFDEAEAAYQDALRLDPRHADAHANLGNCCKARGRLDEALGHYQLSLWLKPDSAPVRFNRSLALLQRGDWAEGWAEYEWRLRKGTAAARCPSPRPAWDGGPGEGRTILLWAEQGLGDVIQFARYAPLARERGFRVVLVAPGILCPLLRTLAGVDELVAEGRPLPPHDVQCPLLGLPFRFGTTPETVPAAVPYLADDPALRDRWARRLGGPAGLTVGVYWQGNPHHPWDRHRSIPLRDLAPLGRVPGVRVVSLQQGPGRDQLDRGPDAAVLDPGPEFQSVDDLAAVASQVDLVVTVDTAAAHLAGALGRPVRVLLSAMTDWRWLRGRPDSPWYPTARLFRQRRLGDWRPVLDEVADDLRRHPTGSGRRPDG